MYIYIQHFGQMILLMILLKYLIPSRKQKNKNYIKKKFLEIRILEGTE